MDKVYIQTRITLPGEAAKVLARLAKYPRYTTAAIVMSAVEKERFKTKMTPSPPFWSLTAHPGNIDEYNAINCRGTSSRTALCTP